MSAPEGFYQEFYVGRSDTNSRIIAINEGQAGYETYKQIPPNHVIVPVHTQYGDTFSGKIQGNHITVTRTDTKTGWGQELRVMVLRDFDASEISNLLTIVISTSPRPQDPDISFEHIKTCYESLRSYAELARVRIIISCDGQPPVVDDAAYAKYLQKIQKIRESDMDVEIVQHAQWLHQAVGLKRVMSTITTPMVMSIQDDSMIFGRIDFNVIFNSLLERHDVEYILFHKHPWINGFYRYPACVDSSGYLRKLYSWSDRPHIARVSHYNNRVWPLIPDEMRGNMEHKCHRASMTQQNWNLWTYAPENDVMHEDEQRDVISTTQFGRCKSDFN